MTSAARCDHNNPIVFEFQTDDYEERILNASTDNPNKLLPFDILWEPRDSTPAAALAKITQASADSRSGFLVDCAANAPTKMNAGSQSARRIAIVRHPEQLELESVRTATGYYVPGTHCRQADILQAVSSTGKPVWIERGSFLAPTDVAHIARRFQDPSAVTLVEAGSHFGYDDRVLDPRALALYEDWGLRISLSITDLLAGDGAGSPYRPQWAEELKNNRSFLNAIMRIRTLWNAGIVVKSHPRAADFADSYVKLITQELVNQTPARKDV